MSLSENILDEGVSDIAKNNFVRTLKIQRVEMILIWGSLAFMVWSIWNLVSQFFDSTLEDLFFHILFDFILYFTLSILAFISVIWWRSESIRYDNSPISQIKLPPILSVLRILISPYAIVRIFYSITTFLYIYNNANLGLSMILYIFFMSLLHNILLLLYIYHFYITRQSMLLVNQ